ncbi:hypothetical protein [Caldalkalibacillus mannanilyticus]|uniref:hypothetical protein n=1 Tax=Caldalkalibacillus mannanilyticus TaxID=1418 RepID=UPI0004680F59|nr:hypothetical protein [Caldalkalibacillus mannanilyticus]
MEKWHKIWICSIFIFSFSILGYFFITADFTHLTVSNYIGIFFFVLLLFLVVSFPVMINNTHIVIIQPILLAVFLQYGLLVEIVVSQVTILFFLVKAGFRQWERYLLNLMMFLVTSVGAAMVFFLLGGHTNPHIDSIGNVQVLPIIAYVGVCIAINHVILFFMLNKLYKEHSSFLSKDLMWEIFINLLLTPIGVLIYVLYGHFHIQAIFYA